MDLLNVNGRGMDTPSYNCIKKWTLPDFNRLCSVSNPCPEVTDRICVVAESIEHWSRMWEIVASNPGRVKPMTYEIDTCHFLAR